MLLDPKNGDWNLNKQAAHASGHLHPPFQPPTNSPIPLILLLPPLPHSRRPNRAPAPAPRGRGPLLPNVGELIPEVLARIVHGRGAVATSRPGAVALDEAHEVVVCAAGALLGLAGDGRGGELGLLAEVGLGELGGPLAGCSKEVGLL